MKNIISHVKEIGKDIAAMIFINSFCIFCILKFDIFYFIIWSFVLSYIVVRVNKKRSALVDVQVKYELDMRNLMNENLKLREKIKSFYADPHLKGFFSSKKTGII